MRVNINGEKWSRLRFVEDIVLIANSIDEAAATLEKLASQKVGLKQI